MPCKIVWAYIWWSFFYTFAAPFYLNSHIADNIKCVVSLCVYNERYFYIPENDIELFIFMF